MKNHTQFVCKRNNRIFGYEDCTSFVDPDFVPQCECAGYCVKSEKELEQRDELEDQFRRALS